MTALSGPSRAIAQWFATYGATLDDATSFRRQLEVLRADLRIVGEVVDTLSAAGEMDQEWHDALIEGEALAVAIEARLAAITGEQVS